MIILIKNADILDGSGGSPFRGDVLIKDDKITAIGKFGNKKADLIIDGLGLHLMPGFIDINSSSDHFLSLFSDPTQSDFIRQGVTTIIGGNDGASLAPLLYGTLESIRQWNLPEIINVNWHSVDEFLDVLVKLKLGVNFGTLIGHSTIRRALIGDASRELTIPELNVFKKIVGDSLDEGAFGLSTGLGSVHAKQASYMEIKELARLTAKKGGMYATHLRNEEDGLLASIEENVRLQNDTGINIEINHLRPLIGLERYYKEAMSYLEKNDIGKNITFDIYPFDISILTLYKFLPKWAQTGSLEIMNSYLESSLTRERILNEITDRNLESIRIIQAPAYEYLVGESLEAFAKNRGIKSLKIALYDLMKTTKLRATVFYKNINLDLLMRYFGLDRLFVGSNVASLSSQFYKLNMDRFRHAFPRFLEIVNEKGEMPLEKAVKKITFDVARKLGLSNRGLIREGKMADLVLCRLGKRMQVEYVFINGVLVFKDNNFQNIFAGRVLRKK